MSLVVTSPASYVWGFSPSVLLQCCNKLLRPFTDALHMHRQLEPAALFNKRDQLVKVRPRVRPDQHDPHGMKQVFSLGSGFGFDLIHNGLESLRCERLARGLLRKG